MFLSMWLIYFLIRGGKKPLDDKNNMKLNMELNLKWHCFTKMSTRLQSRRKQHAAFRINSSNLIIL